MAKYVIQTQKGAAPQGAYSQGWRAGDFIFVTGTGPVDAKTGRLAGDTIEAQTEQVITNMESVLAADNAALADVVKVTVHLSDTSLFARYNAVYARRFSAPYPVRTTVGSDLRQLPGMLIEADCIAYAPQKTASAMKSSSKQSKAKQSNSKKAKTRTKRRK
jgi:2-iminobutanoate/2-iminopropanoate deaminase